MGRLDSRIPALAGLLGEVEKVYSDLAHRPIERRCQMRTECCHFQITGLTPMVTRGEALLAAKAFRATGRKSIPSHPEGACPMLGPGGKCLIYQGRPFGCRTHFCEAAGGPYSRREVVDLVRRLEAVDRSLSGNGPRPFQEALEEAVEELARGR